MFSSKKLRSRCQREPLQPPPGVDETEQQGTDSVNDTGEKIFAVFDHLGVLFS